MSKRTADTEINHDNWDQDEESEDPGVFVQAKEEVLKGRVIRKAKRTGLTSGGSGGSAAFKGFSGFGAKPAATAAPAFSFGSGTSKPLGGTSPLGAKSSLAPLSGTTLPAFSFGHAKPLSNGSDSTKTTSPSKTSDNAKPSSPAKSLDASKPLSNGTDGPNKTKYLSQLKSLNQSVTKWISEHVSKNACCVLTPIFKDYEKHLAEIEKLNPENNSNSSTKSITPVAQIQDASSTTITASGGFKLSSELGTKTTAAPSSGPVFNLGQSTTAGGVFGGSSSTGGSIFGGSSSTGGSVFGGSSSTGGSVFGGSSSTPFGSSSSLPFGGSRDAKSAAFNNPAFSLSFKPPEKEPAAATGGGEDEEYQPPKVEVQEVKEDDAFYTKRCKLFYQKDGAWVERGVGNVHLKPCNGKTQLVMRADTSLGNILLNILLVPSMPLKRQGKNNVSLICVPNPPLDPKLDEKKPANMLIRVKTGEDADELLEQMQKTPE